jgi:hypothetical protein
MPIQEREFQPNQPLMPQPADLIGEAEIRPEKTAEGWYWWHAPWGEVVRVTKFERIELMKQWLESGK